MTTNYILVSGNKREFEKKLNKLSKDGYAKLGNMNAAFNGFHVEYSILMVKKDGNTPPAPKCNCSAHQKIGQKHGGFFELNT